MRIDLPGGAWADIKELSELKGGDKVAVERAIKFTPNADGSPTEVSAAMTEDMQMALLGRVITAWSFEDKPLPATPEVLLDLSLDVYNALSEATSDHMEVVRIVPNRRTPSA